MTFTAVSAGQLVKASITNANLRHVGRLGTDLIPMDNSGVGDDAAWDLGSASYQWKNLYISGDIIQNGSPFVSGGGGSTLELLEVKSHLEKQGINYPISAIHGLNESFTDTTNVVITPRKGYTSGTTFVADINKTDIDLMNATTGWTGGKTTGTSAILATDTTAGEFLEGTASNKLTITAVSDLAYMIKDFTAFSLVDQFLTLSMYLDNLPAGLVSVGIRLSSTAGGATNYYQYNILKANLVAGAGTFNHFSVDPNNDTPDSTDGTYVIGSTIAINIYFNFNASSTMLAAVDFIVRQPNFVLPLPMSYYIWDSTNQERLAIASVAGTAIYQRRIYTITALSNAYAVGSSYAKERNVTISNNQGVFPSGLAGAVALTVYDQTTTWFPDTVTGKTLNMSQRFYDVEYKITALTSTTETKIYSATDLSTHFLSGDKVILYNKTWTGRKYVSMYNATVGANFKLVTLTSNASYSGTDIVLTHTGESNNGMSVGNWYAVRYSAEMLYKLEAASEAGALSTLTPSIFLPREQGIPYPTIIQSHWPLNEVSGGNAINKKQPGGTYDLTMVGTVGYSSDGKCGHGSRNGFSTLNYFQSTSTVFDATTYLIDGWFRTSVTGAAQHIINKFTVAGALGFDVYIDTANKLIAKNGATTLTSSNTFADGLWHYFQFCNLATSGANNTRLYVDTGLQAQATGASFSASENNLRIGLFSGLAFDPFQGNLTSFSYANTPPTSWVEAELIGINRYRGGIGAEYGNNIGYIASGSVDAQSGDKLTTGTKLTRSAAGQFPTILQREAEVV